MSHAFQASPRQALRMSKGMTSGVATQRSHQSHAKTRVSLTETLYMVININKSFLHPKIAVRLDECMKKRHSDDACNPE
jgi:hypothetical protein